jgi:hypothetical protein
MVGNVAAVRVQGMECGKMGTKKILRSYLLKLHTYCPNLHGYIFVSKFFNTSFELTNRIPYFVERILPLDYLSFPPGRLSGPTEIIIQPFTQTSWLP